MPARPSERIRQLWANMGKNTPPTNSGTGGPGPKGDKGDKGDPGNPGTNVSLVVNEEEGTFTLTVDD